MEQVAWITGCSRGLGKAMADGLLERGWKVAGCARSPLESPLGHFQSLDVRQESAVKEFCQQAHQVTGAPDLLINNAALVNRPAALWEVPAEEFDAVIDVNLKGMANVIRHAVPLMIEKGSGIIVNLSSGWGRSVSAEVAPYCATKWGVEGLTKALAEDLPRGLGAVALNPGVIDTDMLRTCWAEGASGFPTAEEWKAAAIPFLESLSPRQNGASLTVA
ncbi:MAG: SDR family oxidoreductase [Verrucomicrobiota bacterium JB023]|nr:SDR family oxidoreductase [Verrucomicrobiota bacterium JB023]